MTYHRQAGAYAGYYQWTLDATCSRSLEGYLKHERGPRAGYETSSISLVKTTSGPSGLEPCTR